MTYQDLYTPRFSKNYHRYASFQKRIDQRSKPSCKTLIKKQRRYSLKKATT